MINYALLSIFITFFAGVYSKQGHVASMNGQMVERSYLSLEYKATVRTVNLHK